MVEILVQILGALPLLDVGDAQDGHGLPDVRTASWEGRNDSTCCRRASGRAPTRSSPEVPISAAFSCFLSFLLCSIPSNRRRALTPALREREPMSHQSTPGQEREEGRVILDARHLASLAGQRSPAAAVSRRRPPEETSTEGSVFTSPSNRQLKDSTWLVYWAIESDS